MVKPMKAKADHVIKKSKAKESVKPVAAMKAKKAVKPMTAMKAKKATRDDARRLREGFVASGIVFDNAADHLPFYQ